MTEATQAPEATESPQFAIEDLHSVVRIIDAAAERGAFRGNELTAVGGIRDKLANFLKAVTPPAEEPAAPVAEEVKPVRKTRKKA